MLLNDYHCLLRSCSAALLLHWRRPDVIKHVLLRRVEVVGVNRWVARPDRSVCSLLCRQEGLRLAQALAVRRLLHARHHPVNLQLGYIRAEIGHRVARLGAMEPLIAGRRFCLQLPIACSGKKLRGQFFVCRSLLCVRDVLHARKGAWQLQRLRCHALKLVSLILTRDRVGNGVALLTQCAPFHRLDLLDVPLVAALVELGARVRARARPELLLDLVMGPCRVVTDQVVKNAHVAIDGLQKLLLISLHLTF